MPTKNAAVIFQAMPTGFPIPGEHLVYQADRTIDLDNVPLNGGFLVKALSLGIDPYLRNRMAFAYTLGKPMLGWGIGVVLRSEHPGYKVGDHVYTEDYPFEEYTLFEKDAKPDIPQDEGLPWSTYLGVLGLAGKTAWTGYKALAKAQKGETIYISSASGVVGSVVCQIAKAEGLKVIASAGSSDKVDYLRNELGVDVAFNYKAEALEEVLKQHGPIDIFWDSVGGETLEKVINHMSRWGRIVVCGFISEYNTTEPYGVKNTRLILVNSLTVSGFNVFHLVDKYGDFNFYPEITKLVREGKLKVREQVSTNLADAGRLLLDVQKGLNTGKPVINLA